MPIQKLDVTMSDLNGHQYKVLEHIWDNFAENDPDNPAGSFLNFKSNKLSTNVNQSGRF